MHVFSSIKKLSLLTATAVLAISMTTGCKSKPKVDPIAQEQARKVRFDKAMTSATREINKTDLVAARSYLSQAKREAKGYDENRKIQSLDALISGAEAMMKGDISEARSTWAGISDPYLQKELRSKAEVVGVDVPMNK